MSLDREIITSAASRLIPGSASLDAAGRERFHALIEHTLNSRSPSMQRQFALFLTAIRWLPVLRWGHRFPFLSQPQQDAFLSWLQNNSLTLLRQGFWGLKTIICMGYYGQVELSTQFAYHPKHDGNAELDAR